MLLNNISAVITAVIITSIYVLPFSSLVSTGLRMQFGVINTKHGLTHNPTLHSERLNLGIVCILSFWWFSSVWIICADISEHIFIGDVSFWWFSSVWIICADILEHIFIGDVSKKKSRDKLLILCFWCNTLGSKFTYSAQASVCLFVSSHFSWLVDGVCLPCFVFRAGGTLPAFCVSPSPLSVWIVGVRI
jgi:hypothetical protein